MMLHVWKRCCHSSRVNVPDDVGKWASGVDVFHLDLGIKANSVE